MKTQTRRIRDAIEPVLYNSILANYPEVKQQLERELIEAIKPLMLQKKEMSAETADLLGFNNPELNAKLQAESDMRERVEEKLKTVPGNTPEWDKTIKALVKAEKDNGWTIEEFWDWNEHDGQKYEKLRFGDLVKKPVLIIYWLPKAFEEKADATQAPKAPQYDDSGRMV